MNACFFFFRRFVLFYLFFVISLLVVFIFLFFCSCVHRGLSKCKLNDKQVEALINLLITIFSHKRSPLKLIFISFFVPRKMCAFFLFKHSLFHFHMNKFSREEKRVLKFIPNKTKTKQNNGWTQSDSEFEKSVELLQRI